MDFRYFSSLGEGKRFGRILQAGRLTKQVPQPWRTLSTYAIVLLESGSGFFWSGGEVRQRVSGGDLMLLLPGVPHSYGPEQEGNWTEFFLVFDGAAFDMWQEMGWLNPERPVWAAGDAGVWSRRLEGVLRQSGLESEEQALTECSRLFAVLAELLEARSKRERRPGDAEWRRAVEALLSGDPSLDSDRLANRLGMSPRSFRGRFLRVFGESLRDWRGHRRADQACRLLIETDLAVREIAERLGFCDEFYFSAAFKKAVGHSPLAYRGIFGSKVQGVMMRPPKRRVPPPQ
jgi:AraC-like DNA-binding protein